MRLPVWVTSSLGVLISLMLVTLTAGSEFFADIDNREGPDDGNFLRLLHEVLRLHQSPLNGKRADPPVDLPAPGFLGARGRRDGEKRVDAPPPPGFMGARGKRQRSNNWANRANSNKRDPDDYADGFLGVRG